MLPLSNTHAQYWFVAYRLFNWLYSFLSHFSALQSTTGVISDRFSVLVTGELQAEKDQVVSVVVKNSSNRKVVIDEASSFMGYIVSDSAWSIVLWLIANTGSQCSDTVKSSFQHSYHFYSNLVFFFLFFFGVFLLNYKIFFTLKHLHATGRAYTVCCRQEQFSQLMMKTERGKHAWMLGPTWTFISVVLV